MSNIQTQSSVLNLAQAAAYLRISKAHLSKVLRGKVAGVPPVKTFRLGRRVLFKLSWIEEWLDQDASSKKLQG